MNSVPAAKVVRLGRDPKEQLYFLREASMLRTLRHTNIVASCWLAALGAVKGLASCVLCAVGLISVAVAWLRDRSCASRQVRT